ncbi:MULTISPECIES: hypothetical protein [unclassified Neptuniibacter]|uniref:hypothetical protein n=1 Tax=unclassified Neptuniibacter TaxID=2630693 RepID=UPI000C4ADA48|nr:MULTISPECIES: hypothetical protein [unclassified Neptuniibacter]MAY42506.1 hypothetical protein [Oceanospirillaceae bacterium]
MLNNENLKKRYAQGVKLAFMGWVIAIVGFVLAYNSLLLRDICFVIVVTGIGLTFIGTFIAGSTFKKMKGDEDHK